MLGSVQPTVKRGANPSTSRARFVDRKAPFFTSLAYPMPSLNVDCDDLAHILTAYLAPKVERVECAVQDAELTLRLRAVDTGAKLMGRAVPRIDVDLHLSARLLGLHTAEANWRIGSIAGLPSVVYKALPTERMTRDLVVAMVEKAGWQDYVDIGDNRLIVHLDRLDTTPLSSEQVRYEELAMPGPDGGAFRLRVRVI